jgi:hypothetical protein
MRSTPSFQVDSIPGALDSKYTWLQVDSIHSPGRPDFMLPSALDSKLLSVLDSMLQDLARCKNTKIAAAREQLCRFTI